MTSSSPHDNEQQLIHACRMLVARHVQERLAPEKRGILSSNLVKKNSRTMVKQALDGVVTELVDMVNREVPDITPPTQDLLGGKISVMNNTLDCTKCGRVTRLAHHTYERGVPVRVECEVCQPIGKRA